jgi:hypothetical protein
VALAPQADSPKEMARATTGEQDLTAMPRRAIDVDAAFGGEDASSREGIGATRRDLSAAALLWKRISPESSDDRGRGDEPLDHGREAPFEPAAQQVGDVGRVLHGQGLADCRLGLADG